MTRPSESLTAAIGTIVGAVLILVGAFTDFEISAEVSGAAITVIAYIAAAATWWIARKQRQGRLKSAVDGTVQVGI